MAKKEESQEFLSSNKLHPTTPLYGAGMIRTRFFLFQKTTEMISVVYSVIYSVVKYMYICK